MKKSKLTKKRIIILSSVLVVLVVSGIILVPKLFPKTQSTLSVTQSTATVKRGDLSVTLSGSGAVEPSSREDISSSITGTIVTNNIEEGKFYNKGDILIELDKTDALMSLKDSENSLLDKQLSLQDEADTIASLDVKAPFNGVVTAINVKEGDSVNSGATLLTITDESELVCTLPFQSDVVKNMSVGDTVTVFLQDLRQTITGTISKLNSNSYISASGGKLNDIEITVKNPGLLSEGATVTAEWINNGNTYSCTSSSTLSYPNSEVVTTDTTADVKNILVEKNQAVKANDLLIELSNDTLVRNYDSANLQLENQKYQYQVAEDNLEKYTITAPIDGYIVNSSTYEVGSELKSGSTVAEMINMDKLTFDVSIDELDISKVQVGQPVNISLDAIESTTTTPIVGNVSSIAIDSTSSNGVTTYPVTISFDGQDGILGGMNADAEILVSDATDALYVPIEAVTTVGDKSYVWVQKSTESTTDTGSESGQTVTNGPPDSNFAPPDSTNTTGSDNSSNNSTHSFQGSNSTDSDNTDSDSTGSDSTDSNSIGSDSTDSNNIGSDSTSSGNTGSGSTDSSSYSSRSHQGSSSTEKSSSTNSYYAGAERIEVETGIHNDLYIQILSGLSEGEVVVLPKLTQSSSSSTTTNSNSGMGGGGMPGGEFRGGF